MRLAAIVRILAGMLFVAEGWSKIAGEFVRGGFGRTAAEIAKASWPFWRRFLESTVIPHAAFFAWILALGELAIGVGLILGLWTRVACAGGVVLMLVFSLGQARPAAGAPWSEWITSGLPSKLALLLFLLLFAADAGKVWGLDARLSRPSPRARIK